MSSLNRIAHEHEPHTREARGRIVPSSFDPNDPDLSALTLPENYRWDTCHALLEHTGPRGVMSRLPLFWQCEMLLHQACRDAQTYLFVCDRENLPVGALALEQRVVDTVVTDLDDYTRFSRYLIDHAYTLPKQWLVVRNIERAEEPLPLRLRDTAIYEEMHVVPGVPILWQCSALSENPGSGYHRSEVSIPELRQYRPAFTFKEDTLCTCGKRIVHVAAL